jgi:hypothetical protein
MTGSYSCMSSSPVRTSGRAAKIVVSVLLGRLAGVHAVMPRAAEISTAEDRLTSSTVTARGSSS